VCKDDVMISVL